ncbi:MAG TPA: fibronectin type III domain-containing protein [Actinomycetota bacterium]|nr:fibronectin type III domain-containing protein [Actinomycetota bacterium]
MNRRTHIPILLSIVPGLLIATPAVAAPEYSPEVTLSSAGQDATSHRMAGTPDGNAELVTWRRSDGTHTRIQARWYRNGGWTSVATLSEATGDAAAPQVAVSDAGTTAVVTWVMDDGQSAVVQSRWYSNGTWGPVQQIGSDNAAGDVRVDLSADGHKAMAVWRNGSGADRRVRSARAVDGTWTLPQSLTGASTDSVTMRLDLNAAGDQAQLAWRRLSGASYRLETRNWNADTGWGPAQFISAAGVVTDDAIVKLLPAGAAILWREQNNGVYQAMLRKMAGGSWGPATRLSADSADVADLHLAATPDAMWAAWSRSTASSSVVEVTRGVDGAWSEPVAVSDPAAAAIDPALAVSEAGHRAVAVWKRNGGQGQQRVDSAQYVHGQWTDPVAASGTGAIANTPLLAADSATATRGILIWTGYDGSDARLRAAELTAVSVPDAPDQVSAAATGPSQVTVSWNAPFSGRRPITGYEVVTEGGGPGCVTTGLTCTVTGLTGGTHRFRVTAANSQGSSPGALSNPITLVDSAGPGDGATTPGVVRGLRVKVKRNKAVVKWLPEASASSYQVALKKRGAAPRTRAVSVERTRFTVGKGRFRVSVRAIGSAGPGPKAAIKFRVLPRR